MAKTRAQLNRGIRQEATREMLANKGLIQKVLEDAGKIDELARIDRNDYEDEKVYLLDISTAKDKVAMIKTAIDTRLKLIGKYLPDVKQQEFVGEGGKQLATVPVLFTTAGVGVDAEDDIEEDTDSGPDTSGV